MGDPSAEMSKTSEGLKLYVLRHGQAGPHVDDPARDAMRPLTAAGRKEIGVIASSLKALGVSFDLIQFKSTRVVVLEYSFPNPRLLT